MAARFGAVLLVVGLMAGGCANWDSIHRHDTIGDSAEGTQVLLIDAKQRAILTAKRPVDRKNTAGTTQYVDSYRAFCAEPSPDVFSVLSQAASASGSFGQGADSINAAAQLAISSAETGATIARTQTVNMLREMMFRTCERYMSGALDDSQFAVQAIRDQHTMVSILAIEQLTGAVTPPPVVLASNASAGAGGSTNDAIVRLDDAWKAKKTADQNLVDKNAALAALDGDASKTPKTCNELMAKPDSASGDSETQKLTACNKANKDAADATAAQTDAEKHYSDLKALMGAGPVSTSVTAASPAPQGSGSPGTNPGDVSAVANTVASIVKLNFDQDELLLFCVRAMGSSTGSGTTCSNYVESIIAKRNAENVHDAAVLNADSMKLKAVTEKMVTTTTTLFDRFWAKIAAEDAKGGPTNKLNPVALHKIVSNYLTSDLPEAELKKIDRQGWAEDLNKMANLTTKARIRAAFGRLDPAIQRDLAQ